MTTAKEKIESLTNGWYGFALFSGLASVVWNGIGIFSIVGAAMWTFVMFCVTFVLGRMLIKKSSITRLFLIVVCGLFACLSALAVGSSIWSFFGQWSLSLLAYAAFSASGLYMYVRSFRVLTDKSVKAYFA